MLGAFAIDVCAAQSDVAQHSVVELPEQVPAPGPFPPIEKSGQQVRRPPRRQALERPIRRDEGSRIDTILMYCRINLALGGQTIKIDPE